MVSLRNRDLTSFTLRIVAVTGFSLALIPKMPCFARSLVCQVLLMVWCVAILGVIGRFLVRVFSLVKADPKAMPTIAIVCAGVLFSAIGATQLGIARMITGDESLTWSVDSRFFWSLANSIGQSCDLSSNLEYFGSKITYHVGPAWFAGLSERLFPGSADEVLFFVVPLLCVLTILLAMFRLLRMAGLTIEEACLAVTAGSAIPYSVSSAPVTIVTLLRMPFQNIDLAEFHTFSTSLMLNSYFGLAVGMASIVLIMARQGSVQSLLIGILGLASLVALKPQFFVAFGLFVGVIALSRIWMQSSQNAERFRMFFAAALSLLIGVILLRVTPSFDTVGVVLDPFQGVVSPKFIKYELFRISSIIGMFALLSVLFAMLRLRVRASEAQFELKRWVELFVLPFLTFILLVCALSLIDVRLNADLEDLAAQLGVYSSREATFAKDMLQTLIPLRYLVVVTGIGGIIFVLLRHRRSSSRMRPLIRILASLLLLTQLPQVVLGLHDPYEHGFCTVSERGLDEVLESLGGVSARVIVSDLADPGEDYSRPANGTLIAAYQGDVQVYLSNLRYLGWLNPDWPDRLRQLERFFGSAWSPWHSFWLQQNHITHVITNDRCIPSWIDSVPLPLEVVSEAGGWKLFSTAFLPRNDSESPTLPEWVNMAPQYGQAECLLPMLTGVVQ